MSAAPLPIYFDDYSLDSQYCSNEFNEKRSQVHRNAISWMAFFNCNKINKHELDTIEKLDNLLSLGSLGSFMEENGPSVAECLVKLLKCVSQGPSVEYLLDLMLRLFESQPRSIMYFEGRNYSYMCECLTKIMTSLADFASVAAFCLLAKVFCFGTQPIDEGHFHAFMVFAKVQIGTNSTFIGVIMRNMKFLFRVEQFHAHLFDHGFVKTMPTLIINSDIQVAYPALFCIWCITFTKSGVLKLFDMHTSLIGSVCQIVANFKKEKMLRMSIFILNNMLKYPELKQQNKAMSSLMAHNDLHVHFSSILKSGDVKDEEMVTIITSLTDKIQSSVEDLTSFEQYQIELTSGKLKNTMLHSNESFWKDNIERFLGTNDEIEKLIQFLNNDNDLQSIKLALEDINLYLKHHPLGKVNLNELDVKSKLYELLKHQDNLVKMKALSTIQKLLIN